MAVIREHIETCSAIRSSLARRSTPVLAMLLSAACGEPTGSGPGTDHDASVVDVPQDGPLEKHFAQAAYIKASNTGTQDWFGYTIALSADGTMLAVGAPDEDSAAADVGGDQLDDSAPGAGAVYVFMRSGATWAQQAYLKASNTQPYANFGASVALSDDGATLVVGAHTEASAASGIDGNQADNSKPGAGAAYVFRRNATGWAQQAYLKASNPDPGDNFGASLAIAGDGQTIAVGAPGEASWSNIIGGDQADNSAANAGAVYVFRLVGPTWTQEAYVKAANADPNDLFGGPQDGYAGPSGTPGVALTSDGSVLVVGARGEASFVKGVNGDATNNSAPNAGAVYVFTRSGTTWTQQAYLKASNTEKTAPMYPNQPPALPELDRFGGSVAISGDGTVIAVGATGEDSAATGINGDQTDNSVSARGAVYLFDRNGPTWSQRAYIKPTRPAITNFPWWFGSSLALSGDGSLLAVGAEGDDDCTPQQCPYAGAIYMYRRTGAVWSAADRLQGSNAEAPMHAWPGDDLGHSVALSRDGMVLAGGAFGEDSAATGINGNAANNDALFSGAVYVFQ